MKVWMRERLAGLIASPARSMSLKPARARPQTAAVLVRVASEWTAAKSPAEVAELYSFELLSQPRIAPMATDKRQRS